MTKKEVCSSALSTFSLPIIVLFLLGSFALPSFNLSRSQAQAASPITPSGLNTQVNLSQTPPAGKVQYDITGGTRAGTNLFHSFGDFNVPTNNIANFLNTQVSGVFPSTSNILGRVTGGNISNIFGTIQTTNFGNANLFLMNPAGFLFGPNATVNVGGMVAFTSADYLRLADGVRFNAIPNATADALLSAAPVAAFGFLGSNPGAITVQGSQLSVADGTGISLVGGNITVQSGTLDNGTVQPARLSAPGGQINLASVASPGEVSAVDFTPLSGMTMGNISLSQGASLESSADTAGRIIIRGGQLMMDDASIKAISMNGPGGGIDAPNSSPKISITAETIALTNGALITADSYGTAAAGDITLNVNMLTTQAGANRLPLNPTNNFNFAGNIIASDSRSTDAGAGPAGKITIQGVGGPGTAATSVLLKDSTIDSRIFGGTTTTRPSSITITADSVVLTNAGLPAGGRAATLVATTLGPAPGGNIVLNVNTLRSNVNPDETPIAGAKTVFIVTSNDAGSTAGPTGNITISGIRPESTDAAKLVALNNTQISTGADGGTARTPSGNIAITTDTLSLSNDTGIFTEAFSEGGTPAGNITFNVNTLRANTRPDGTLITGVPRVFIDSVSLSGQAGNITISGVGPQTTDTAKQLALNNIELNTVVLGGTAKTAPATLSVAADTIHLSHSENIKTDTQGAAPAGNIVFRANTFLADEATTISSRSSASGPGGNISITAGQSVTLNSGSSITASSTGPGSAGNITITAGNTFASNAATVSSTATQATGGDIAITAGQSVTLTNGANVSASSTGAGNAGNININSGQSFAATNSSVTTQAAAASGGTITISTTPSGRVQLTNSMISASVLDGTGGGGSVNIDPQFVILLNSQILAQAVHGPGGNISIATNLLLPDAKSVISASSQFGVNGNITIQSPNAPAGGKIQPLGKSPLLATSLLNQRCAALAGGELSSFTVAGRDSLPAEPSSWLASPLALGPAGFSAGMETKGGELAHVIDPAHETALLSLRQIAPAGFLTQAFAVDWSAGCQS